MRLIFHAGSHKTGTSTLQHVMYTHRDQLREQGLFYPDPQPWFGHGYVAHHPVAHAVAEGGRRLRRVRRFLDQVRSEADGGEVVLLSTEVPFRRTVKGTADGWWPAHRSYLERLGEELVSFETDVVLVLRRRDRFIESVYHERVSRGSGESFREFLEGAAPRWLNYDRQIKAFGRVFSSVTTARYEDLSSPDLVRGFFDVVGFRPPELAEPVWERRSADARLTQWMAGMNRRDRSRKGIVGRREFSRDPKARALFDDFGKVTLWEDLELRERLLARYGDTPSPDDRPYAPLSPADELRVREAFDAYHAQRRGSPAARGRSALQLWRRRLLPGASRW